MRFAAFLASHAATTGGKDAVVCAGERLSFFELDAQTTRLAEAMRDECGVRPGDRVVVYLPNGIDFVRTFVATIKAGALAVPVNVSLSQSEVAHILRDCRPRVAFISATTWTNYTKSHVEADVPVQTIACRDDCPGDVLMEELLRDRPRSPLDIPFDADPCVVGYTSGTTGHAKGVVLSQSNYMFVNGYLNGWYWRLTKDDVHLCTTPLAHRTGMARMMNMILHGSTMVIMPRFDAAEAARLVKQECVTVFGMVPTVGRMMLPQIQSRPQDFASVRVVLVTGEAFPVAVKRSLHEALPDVRIYSFYAMTEAGAIAGLDHADQFTKPDSVGRPWPGVEVKLCDERGEQVPIGAVGEVWIRTGIPGFYSTMSGYFGRPEETCKTIRNGWVASGDMGRFDGDGFLYLVDRKKDMVLSGGYNIYSKEVELAIQAHPAVRDVAVIGVPDPVFGESVAAYVEVEPGHSVDAQGIVEHCRERIASYKKPKHVRFVDELPRNSMGKVLKTVLRDTFRRAGES